ncbi:hypothetical protein AK88_03340 [Plasmodium fragile]|uniref:Schizont-infected cell agglutination C-terminal domain-containing protein n=1 Tax=Plasmodium fragile TaxID=5857 RepID=A0A0D9QJ41_PLAFR|nr:uncharacterized protein AK88_03340 [Plasmodium fragile]KJP87054.1 hypothetical protein AK88_03340 [Plasmodium fragile]
MANGPWMEILRLYAHRTGVFRPIKANEQGKLRSSIQKNFKEFMEHIISKSWIELYGSNCNSFEKEYLQENDNDKDGSGMTMTQEDKVACNSMIGALLFVNGWNISTTHRHRAKGSEQEIDDFVRCAIANIFMYRLEELFCDAKRGIQYAWHVMKRMELPNMENLIRDGKCNKNMSGYGTGWDASAKKKVKSLLQTNGEIVKGVERQGMVNKCEQPMQSKVEEKKQADTVTQVKSKDETETKSERMRDRFSFNSSSIEAPEVKATGGVGMWQYLILLWDDYIETRNIGVQKEDIVHFGEHFWRNVQTVWTQFKEYMEQEESKGTMRTSCEALIDPETSGSGSQRDTDICELTLIALHFKHNIHSAVAAATGENVDSGRSRMDPVEAYMRCILVNIFMKKIIGKRCLEMDGGQQAFNLAHGILHNLGGTKVGNISCEEKDAGEGGQRGVKAEDRDFWGIMTRWFERNKEKIRDGDVGILGSSCKVEKKETAKGREGKKQEKVLKEEIKEEIKNVKKEIEQEVSKILEGIGKCSGNDSDCIKKLLEKEKEEEKKKNEPSAEPPEVEKASKGSQHVQTTSSSGVPEAPTADPGPVLAGPAPPSGGRSEEVVETPPPAPPPEQPRPVPPVSVAPEATGASSGKGSTRNTDTTPVPAPKDVPSTGKGPSRGRAETDYGESTKSIYNPDNAVAGTTVTAVSTYDPYPPDLKEILEKISVQPGSGGQDDSKDKKDDSTQGQAPVEELAESAGAGTRDSVPSTEQVPSQVSHPSGEPVTSTDPDKDVQKGSTGTNSETSSENTPTAPSAWGDFDLGAASDAFENFETGGNIQSTTPSGKVFGISPEAVPGVNVPGLESPVGSYAPPTVTVLKTERKIELQQKPKGNSGPDAPDLTNAVLTAITPILFFLTSVIVALLGYSLWKYFAYLAKHRRTYRTVRDVPSPPLDEEILEHLQRGELPPTDFGYTMVRDRQPASTPARRRRHPRVHKRTIIELHLEVLNECEAAEWENVKDDYLQIVVEEFAQQLMQNEDTNNNILGVSTSHAALATHDSTTRAPPTDFDGTDPCPLNDPDAWNCMETIQLATDPCPHNEDDPDPCSCMETIQLEQEESPSAPPSSSDPWNECPTPDHTNWINWIDRNKHILRECTTQPWFLQLKAEWKQYLREHMAENADHGVSAHREFGESTILQMQKLHLWKEWVAQQHRQMRMYGQQEWFQHLLNNVEEVTVPQHGEIPGVEKGIEVEKIMAAADMLRVRDAPRSQPPHEQSYQKKQLIAKLWILTLGLIIEECEMEQNMKETELYVDKLLQNI